MLWPAWSGLAAALFLMFFQIGMKQPLWPFPVALVLGLAVGGARGFMMKLEVDEYWLMVRPSGRRALVWVAGVLVATRSRPGDPGLAPELVTYGQSRRSVHLDTELSEDFRLLALADLQP